MAINLGTANEYTTNTFTVPRIVMSDSDETVLMEILRVDWYIGLGNLGDASAAYIGYLSTRAIRTAGELTSTANFIADIKQASTFAVASLNINVETTGGHVIILPISIDLTDQNGNGILIAVDRLFAIAGGSAVATPTSATCKILYRMTGVTLPEYVGIVATQQAL